MSAGRGRVLMVEQGGRGGVGDYTGQLVAALAAQGWEVELATADDHLLAPIAGVEIRPVFHYARGRTAAERALRRARLGALLNGLHFLRSLPRLVRLARRAQIVHTQGWEVPEIGLLAALCMRLAGARIVQTLHGIVERSGRIEGVRRLETIAMGRLTARTIVHTQADVAGLPPSVRGCTVVIPHGEYGGLARTGGSVEREQAREQLGVAPDAHATLIFGQLRHDKGLGDAVAAAQRLPGLHLLIGGQDLGALSDLAAELERPSLQGRVTVREGFLEMSEAATLFAAADTVALPYRAASQSGVLLLAYGFQRPVVIYPAGGLVEAVEDGATGWICPSADVEGLVQALGEAIAAGPQESARRGELGARLADERFSGEASARRTGELYAEVLSR
jgi:glycosyltransferase involved in cell wall biosynthesis